MSKAVLVLIVCIFLALIGGGIWKRTHMAVAPPVYDPVTYYYRTQLVWSALAKGDLHGILNGPMSVRPPGTALVLYPFGFKASIHEFLFRSVLAPILIWAIALGIPILTKVRSRLDAICGSALVVGLTCMPLFYQFELNDVFTKAYVVSTQWGMVDALEGSIGALATSLLCIGIANKSVKLCALGWFVGGFSFFIKPSGVLVMLALAGVVAVEFFVLYLRSHYSPRAIWNFAWPTYFIGLSVFGVSLGLASHSDYLSREVIANAVRASQLLISTTQEHDILTKLASFIAPVFGWWWFCPGVFFTSLFVVEAAQLAGIRQWSVAGVRLIAQGMILASAICWWTFLSGQEHRYLFPFILMAIAWFVPDLFGHVRAFRPSVKGAIMVYCLAPGALLATMLWSEQPSILLQQLIGVNLTAGSRQSEVNQGQRLFAESARLGRALNLYSLGRYGVAVVETVAWLESIGQKDKPLYIIVKRPLNWVDAPGLRAEELVHSDFLLLEDIRPANTREEPAVSSWTEEVERFKQFAYSEHSAEKSGLELVSDGPVKILRVVDAHNFSEALYKWANSIQWTNDFRDRNKAFLESPQK